LKQLPDFQFALAEDQVLSTFAPNQLKETVKEIFQNLKKLVPQGNKLKKTNDEEQKSFMGYVCKNDELLSKISRHLEEIFCEDSRFFELLRFYLTDVGDYSA
jgi:hypothetical protein